MAKKEAQKEARRAKLKAHGSKLAALLKTKDSKGKAKGPSKDIFKAKETEAAKKIEKEVKKELAEKSKKLLKTAEKVDK